MNSSSYLLFPRESVRKTLEAKLKELKELVSKKHHSVSELTASTAELRKTKDYVAEYLSRAFSEESYKKEFTRALGARLIGDNFEDRLNNLTSELNDKIVRLESIINRLNLIPEVPSPNIIKEPDFSSNIVNIGAANASLSALHNVRENLENISNIYSNFGNAQLEDFQSYVKPIMKNIENIQNIAGTIPWKEIADFSINSPTVKAVEAITDWNAPTLGTYIPDIKPIDILPPKVIKEIKSVHKKRADRIFNFAAYRYIFNLEIYLREFINKYVIKPNEKQLASKIPPEIISEWERKKTEETKNIHVDKTSYELIEYSDFAELKIILEKRTSISLLKNIISEANLKTITSKLYELEPIRKKIAHSRALTEEEFNTLKVYSDKIKKILS